MTRAKRKLVDPDATPYYHCICRSVRRAFLCGEDQLTGKRFEHRKAWVVERLSELSCVFTIDVAAFAVLSNTTTLWLRPLKVICLKVGGNLMVFIHNSLTVLMIEWVMFSKGATKPFYLKYTRSV